MQPLEIEVKFFIEDMPSLRERLLALGAAPRQRAFECNIRFEDECRSLVAQSALLRLRKSARSTLTYKCPPPEADAEFKVHTEIETEVDDASAMQDILERLGFYPEQVYEKERETFDYGQTALCLDAMPFGNFLEIEGPRDDIRAAARALGLNWEQRILSNYLEIFGLLRQQCGLDFTDVTFHNFKGVSADVTPVIAQLAAGKG